MKRAPLLILFILFSCSGVKFQQVDYHNFWLFTSYEPNRLSDIIGTYISSSGFSGEKLILNPDSTFHFSWFFDLYDPNEPYASKGRYYVRRDTLILDTQEIFYDSSSQRTGYVKKIDQKDSTLTKEFKRTHGFDHVFKRIGDNIFLVRTRMKEFWGKFSLENRGFPPMTKFKDKSYSTFFLLKDNQSEERD